MSKGLKTSIAIIVILVISIIVGFIFQAATTAINKNRYPIEYEEYVTQYSHAYGVPEYIVYAVIRTESSFKSNAVSKSGAIGLMQMLPTTFEYLQSLQKETLAPGMLYDPETNIKYGTYYLSYLYSRFNNWDAAFAAYNGGENNVAEWLQDKTYSKDGKHLDSIPREETSRYVEKVQSAMQMYKDLYFSE